MNILIVGASGFLGSRLIRQFSDRRDIVIYAASRNPVDEKVNIIPICMDLSAEADVPSSLKGVQLDAMVHLAGSPGVWFAEKYPLEDLKSNVGSLLTALNIAKECGVRKVVLASTCQVHNLDTNYGISKLMAEKYLTKFAEQFGIHYSILRISWMYGPGMKKNPIFDIIHSRHAEKIKLHINPASQLDFIHVDDVARAICQAIENNQWDDKIVDIASGESTRISALIQLLEEETRKKYTVECATLPVVCSQIDAHEANQLGWSPLVDIKSGFLETMSGI